VKKILAGLAVVGALVAIYVGMQIHYTNTLIDKQNTLQSQYDGNRAELSAYARDIQTRHQLSMEAFDKLAEVLERYTAGRYKGTGNGQGTLINAVSEAVPNVDQTVVIEIARGIHDWEVKYLNSQKALASMANSFDTYRTQIPARWFSGGFPNDNLTARGPDGQELTGADALKHMKKLVTSGTSDRAYDNNRLDNVLPPKKN
jgi:uncharacterized protein YxeA